ncbi:hypothetical protein OAT18_03255 [Tenacibaculum sp.]|nr:hypothetical protein [Tenacibaculum sp.]
MNPRIILRLLRLSCFFVFIGRGYQHLFWDGPYRALFWDQHLLESTVSFFLNRSWQEYVTDLNTDNAIQLLTRSIGVFYMLCGMLCLIVGFKSQKWIKNTLKVGVVSLVFLAVLLTKSKFYHLAMFFEHAIQFGVPFSLLMFIEKKDIKNLILQLKILIALAFICHGMYAIGVLYPLPGNFVTMTLNIVPVTEVMAKELLFMAGIFDFIVAILIFNSKTIKYAVLYATIWGLVTALARILSGMKYGITMGIFHQYMYQVIYRLPHGLIPLLVYLYVNKADIIKKTKAGSFGFEYSVNE